MNMSYCRFQNTAQDLKDCLENLHSLDPDRHDHNDREEKWARRRIIMMAAEIMQDLGIDDVYDTHALQRRIEELDKEPIDQDEEA